MAKASQSTSPSKGVSTAQKSKLLLTPCKTKQELRAWIKYFLDMEIPDVRVSRYADTTPMDAIWEMYEICVLKHNPQKINELLYVASRGAGKCCHEDSMVLTKKGPRRIAVIRKGDFVWSGVDWRKVTETYNEGEQEGVEVHTSGAHGFPSPVSLVGSMRHQITWLSRTGHVEWKLMRELRNEDLVFRQLDVPVPDSATERGFLRGWVLGCIASSNSDSDSEKIRFHGRNEQVAAEFVRAINQILTETEMVSPDIGPYDMPSDGIDTDFRVEKRGKDGSVHIYTIDDEVPEWARARFRPNGPGYTELKLCHQHGKFDIIAGFISGLMDCSADPFNIRLERQELAEFLCEMLTAFGVRAGMLKRKKAGKKFYVVRLSGQMPSYLRPRFPSADFAAQQAKVCRSRRYPTRIGMPLVRAAESELGMVDGKLKGGERMPHFGLVCNLRKEHPRHLNHKQLVSLAEWAESKGLPEQAAPLRFAASGVFERVRRVRKTKAKFFDLEVETDHSYWSNGFVSHNTLSAAIAEFLVVLHDARDVAHVGAIMAQAKRAYAYMQGFYLMPNVKEVISNDKLQEKDHLLQKNTMEKSSFKINSDLCTVEVVPCTIRSCNDPESVMVLEGGRPIKAKDIKVGDRLLTLDIDSLKVNKSVTVIRQSQVDKPMVRVSLQDGRTLIAAENHLVLTNTGWVQMKDLSSRVLLLDTEFKEHWGHSDYRAPEREWNKESAFEALIGMMLGDASLCVNPGIKPIPRISFSHSIKQRDYYDYCKEALNPLLGEMSDYPYTSGYGAACVRATSKCCADLFRIQELFFDKNSKKKRITRGLEDFLTPTSLAFWFADDGSCVQSVKLATCGFSDEDRAMLVGMLDRKFKLSHVVVDTKGSLVFNADDSLRFLDIIKDHLPSCMSYKLMIRCLASAYRISDGRKQPGQVSTGRLPREHGDTRGYRKWRGLYKKQNFIGVISKQFVGVHPTVELQVDSARYSEQSYVCNGIISHNTNGIHASFVCIGEKTEIATDKGDIGASELFDRLQAGEEIRALSYDIQNKKVEHRRITKAYDNGTRHVIALRIGAYRTLWCTPEHKIYDPLKRKYLEARMFRPRHGDLILRPDGESQAVLEVAPCAKKQRVFDFTVEGNNNFFAGQILVHNCVDEIDTLSGEGLRAFKEISGMLDTKKGKRPLRVGISTRKSTYGLMNKQMTNAAKEGRHVRQWTALEFTERCPDSRSGTKKATFWVNQDKGEILTTEDLASKSEEKRKEYHSYELYEKCIHCPVAPWCLGDAKKQNGVSSMLKTIDELIQKVLAEGADWTAAQLFNLKPSLEGIVFRELDDSKHVKTWNQMWQILTGQAFPGECTHDMFVRKCHEMGLPCYGGLDFGWSSPSTVLFLFIDKRDNVYVVRADGMTYVNDPNWIHYVKTKHHPVYRCQLYFPDVANGSAVDLMKNAALPVSDKIDKSINLGIQTIKKFLFTPGSGHPKMFISADARLLLDEMRMYHYRTDASGTITDDPEDDFNHWIDPLRYILTAFYGKQGALVQTGFDLGTDSVVDGKGNFLQAPTAKQYAEANGIQLNDVHDDMTNLGRVGRLCDLEKLDEDKEDVGGEGSFLFSL